MTTGPEPMGFWSSHEAANSGKYHGFLHAGKRYKVLKPFTDYDGQAHQAGEEWVFLGCSFQPYEDGMSFFVSFDGRQEWHIRLQWRPEEQGHVLDSLEEHLVAL